MRKNLRIKKVSGQGKEELLSKLSMSEIVLEGGEEVGGYLS